MARFDAYLGKRGYILDVQSDILEGLESRIVVPLFPPSRIKLHIHHLNPILQVQDRPLVMFTQLIAAIPRTDLGVFQVSLAHEADKITRALDMALQGF